jgi:hypothetical protein
MTPDASCLCVDLGIWAATNVDGPSRTRMLDRFLEAHSSEGHVLENPPRSWYGEEAELGRLLARLKP